MDYLVQKNKVVEKEKQEKQEKQENIKHTKKEVIIKKVHIKNQENK